MDPFNTHSVKTSLQSFRLLGICREHIPHLQILCKPLYAVTNWSILNWGPQQQRALDLSKL